MSSLLRSGRIETLGAIFFCLKKSSSDIGIKLTFINMICVRYLRLDIQKHYVGSILVQPLRMTTLKQIRRAAA